MLRCTRLLLGHANELHGFTQSLTNPGVNGDDPTDPLTNGGGSGGAQGRMDVLGLDVAVSGGLVRACECLCLKVCWHSRGGGKRSHLNLNPDPNVGPN